LHGQSKAAALHFRIEHAPHHVSFRRPEMQQALVVFARDRITGRLQIKPDRTILKDDCRARPRQKLI